MPILSLSNDQVIELIKQLPRTQQEELLIFLLTQPWYSCDFLDVIIKFL